MNWEHAVSKVTPELGISNVALCKQAIQIERSGRISCSLVSTVLASLSGDVE